MSDLQSRSCVFAPRKLGLFTNIARTHAPGPAQHKFVPFKVTALLAGCVRTAHKLTADRVDGGRAAVRALS